MDPVQLHATGAAHAELLGAVLDLTARPGSLTRSLRLRGVGGALLLAGGLLLLWWMALQLGAALALLLLIAAAGFGLTHLSGLDLEIEERLAFGMLLGAGAFAVLVLAVAMLLGFGLATVLVAAGLTAAAGGAAFAWRRQPLHLGVADLHRVWPLLLLLAVAWPYTVHFLSQVYVYLPDGLYAGYVNVWGDWAAHLSYTGSFAYGQNFPPELPIDPGNHFIYPFMADLFSASMVPLGASLPSALVQGSGYLALAFPAVMYLAGRRFLGGRAAAALAVLIFVAGGGIGFVYWLPELSQHGLAALQHIPREYTLNRDQWNIQWLDPVLAYLLPQRSTLFGFSLLLVVMAVLFLARERESWLPYAFAGVTAGLTPWFHIPAYGTMVTLAAFWVMFDRRRHWAAFFVPALLLGLPALAWLWPPASTPIRFQLGWMAGMNGHRDSIAWFWFLNLGLFIPLLLVAQFWPRGEFRRRFAPLWLWFLVPNVAILTQWEWDNTKFFVFWALFGAFLVAGLLVWIAQRAPAGPVFAVLLTAVLCLSGLLDLTRAVDLSQNQYQFVDSRGLRVAAWARSSTPAHSIFLAATDHNEPVAALGGRRVVLGYVGWLWTYQLTDFYQKQTDVNVMLQGRAGAADLVRRYGVGYVVIGPQELAQPFYANAAYWREHGQVVYSDGEYSVYRVA